MDELGMVEDSNELAEMSDVGVEGLGVLDEG